jgi:T-complex protein 1 subunit beta
MCPGDETLLKFTGVSLGEACSVVLRGATEQIIREADVLTSTVKEPRTLYGGGCSEIAENGGYDSAQLVSGLKAQHILGKNTLGLDMEQGKVGPVDTAGDQGAIDLSDCTSARTTANFTYVTPASR